MIVAYPSLFAPTRLFAADEVMSSPSAAPAGPGVYAWYFDEVPPFIDASGCHAWQQRTLLYVGISPKAPPMNGCAPSRSTLKARLRTHYGGNAEGSTLRLTLGCLLAPRLGIELRRVGSGGRQTFTNPGEQKLDKWMHKHAFVSWMQVERPHHVEQIILASGVRLPLNIDGNPRLEDTMRLKKMRFEARRRAGDLPIVVDSGGPRRGETR
jgi:hypothetical protein